jgi:allantoinase
LSLDEVLVVRASRVVLPEGVRPASVHIRDGRIEAVAGYDDVPAGAEVVDGGSNVIAPGLVDTHVHINEPGRTEWEGFDHATRAAAAGGVTTLVDMPLNSIPATTTAAGLEAKRAAAEGRCYVDVGFWGGVVPGNAAELTPLTRAGVLGFKCFLSPSGVDEFGHVSAQDLRAALAVLANLDRPLLVHAELPEALLPIDSNSDPRSYATWLNSRPPESEAAAIALMIAAARSHNARVHVVHLSAAGTIPDLRRARSAGVRITVETCPHYLFFEAEEIDDGATMLKCAPPIRGRANRDALWQGLIEGDIDLIATDHSPAPPAHKHIDDGDFVRAWGGIASLQLGLSAVWTAASGRPVDYRDLARWCSSSPARLAGLEHRKGAIAPGLDADLVIWDPDAAWTVDPSALYHRHAVTPYAGRRLRGRVVRTMLRGETVFDGAIAGAPRGRLLAT